MFGQNSSFSWGNVSSDKSSTSAKIEAAASQKLTNQRIANELGLQKQSFSREFNLNQAQKSADNSRWQGDVLEQGRMDSKQRAAQVQERNMENFQARQSQAQRNTPQQARNPQQESASQKANQNAASTKNSQGAKAQSAPSTLNNANISNARQMSFVPKEAPAANNGRDLQNNNVIRGEFSSHGTQAANKEKISMSAFFLNNQFNASQEQSRGRKRQEDAQQDALGAANPRAGAIIEEVSAQNYNETTLRQVVLPRIQELVLRLSKMDKNWARVVIPLDSQTKLTLNFSTKAGKVRVSLSGASNHLKQMIADGWDILVHESAQNGIALDKPTFERPLYVN